MRWDNDVQFLGSGFIGRGCCRELGEAAVAGLELTGG